MKEHNWEPVIGLEIHAELNTSSKLFSTDCNHFGDEPNTNISEVSVALPGTLPVLNKEAVRKAIQFGLATEGDVQLWSRFERKSYFYPDCPRNYQITQLEFPIVKGGCVSAFVEGEEKTFALNRVQLEDDAGMLKHFSAFAGVDFNRAGVPMIEIVSEACMHSAKEAVAYAQAIRSILDYLDVSDCNMEEGSFRFDVNVSVRKKGETALRTRSEIKNMNSFSNLEQAINFEIARHISLYEASSEEDISKVVDQATFRWDPETGTTILMRTKEDAQDYRYFPDPDLLPLIVTEAEVDAEKEHLPELPLARERRFCQEYGLSTKQSYFFVADRKLADYFEQVVQACGDVKMVCNWIAVEFTGRLKEKGIAIWESGISPKDVGDLICLIRKGAITGKIAKSVADEMVKAPGTSPKSIIKNRPEYQPFQDMDQLKKIVEEVVLENPDTVEAIKNGRDRSFAFLVGQVMKRTKGSAPPAEVNKLLKESMK